MKKILCTILTFAAIVTSGTLCMNTFAKNVKPGINVFTGTEKAFDFEGDTSKVVFHSPTGTVAEVYEDDNGKTVNTVVVREKNGVADNHAASVDGNGYYFYIDCDFPTIDKNRPVKVSYDYILGLSGNQVRTLINYPTKYSAAQRERASFNITYFSKAATEEVWKNVTHTQTPATAKGSSYYLGGEDMEFLSFINYSGKAQASYFDNLICMPYYKVSYDLNGGKGIVSDEYFLQDSGTTYTLKNTGDGIFKNGYAFKGWATSRNAKAEDAFLSFTVVPGEDITLYAVWQQDSSVKDKYLVELYDGENLRSTHVVTKGAGLALPSGEYTEDKFLLGWKTADGNTLHGARIVPTGDTKLFASWGEREVKPGINVIENGDFEKDGIIDLRPSNGILEIVKDGDNSLLKYTRKGDYVSVQHAMKWESGRKYKVSYKIKTPLKVNVYANFVYTDNTGAVNHLVQKSLKADTFTIHEHVFEFPENTDEYTYVHADSDAFSQYSNPLKDVDNIVYYDDFELIPYYKVTYDAAGGSGTLPKDEYFLDGTYTVDNTVKPEREGYTFLGWTLKEGGINLVTEVSPTPGKDVILYAAWENPKEKQAISYTFDNEKAGIADGCIKITLNDETASYTSAQILLGNDDGVLDEYTPFGEVSFNEGVAEYKVTGNRAFAPEVSRLAIRFTGENLDDIYYWYTIPKNKRLEVTKEAIYSFYAISDTHIGGTNYNTDYWPEMTVNRNNAFNDIFNSDADFVFINGDVVNYGTTPYLKVLGTYLDEKLNNPSYNKNNIPVFLTNGNHEYFNTDNKYFGFDYDAILSAVSGQLDHVEKEHGEEFKITRFAEDELWYAVDYKGAKFVFLSSPQVSEDRTDGSSYSYSKEQLEFLDEQLYDGEKSGKTSYLISHVPLKNTIVCSSDGEYETGIKNSDAVLEILAKHPNTIVFSGHTHSDLSVDEGHFTVVGDMTSTVSHINDGCAVWIDSWEGKGDLDSNGEHTRYKKGFSTGVYVEVYEDFILVKSRKFMAQSLYFGHGVYVIELPSCGMSNEHTVTMWGKAVDGGVFKALVDGKEVSSDDGLICQWIVGGNVVGTNVSYTASVKRAFHEKHMILRVTFPDGSYASVMSEDAFSVPNADDFVLDAVITMGNSQNTDLYYADFEKYLGECAIVAAAYNKDGILVASKVLPLCDDEDGIVTVMVDKALESEYVKVFAFDSLGSLRVITKQAESEGNLIVNGDAKGQNKTAFFSENGTVSIVDDEKMGKVWKVVPKSGTQYCYIQQNFDYVPGATYKLTMDVKLLDAAGNTDIVSVINSNTRYRSSDGSSRDHIQSRTNVKAGEWTKVEYTFTISENATPDASDEFAIYCNPVKIDGVQTGASYCVANVEVQLYSAARE